MPIIQGQEARRVIVDLSNESLMGVNTGRSDFQQDYLELRRRGNPDWNFHSPKEHCECQEAWQSLPLLHKQAYLRRGHWDYEKPNEAQKRGDPDLWNAVAIIRSGAALDWVGDPAAGDVALMVPSIPQVPPAVDVPVAVVAIANNDENPNGNGEGHHQQEDGEYNEEIQVLAVFPLRRLTTRPPDSGETDGACDVASLYVPVSSVVDVVVPGVAVMEEQQGMENVDDGDGSLVDPVEEMESDDEFANVVIHVHPQPQEQVQGSLAPPLRRSNRLALIRRRRLVRRGGCREVVKPKTPICSYNFFCRQESKAIARVAKIEGKLVGQKAFGQELGRVWKSLLPEQKQKFIDMMEIDKIRYRVEVEIYKRNLDEAGE